MSDIKKYEELKQRFYWDDDLEPKQKINQTLTKNQAISICNSLLLENKEKTEDILELIKYIRQS